MSSLFKRSSRDKEKKIPKSRVSSTSSTNAGSFAFNELNAPTKVIQATHSYSAQKHGELSFKSGDFFHVLNTVNQNDQYIEAHNPILNVKGNVPSAYFKFFDKTHNNSGRLSAGNSSTSSNSTNSPVMATSSYQDKHSSNDSRNSSTGNKIAPLPSMYGRVLYDFQAERPDELTVVAGDSVIICAHHEYEWFIAKFLDKIGEPGLIPVTYVQLFDITTRIPYSDDSKKVIDNCNLPTVDEWKAIKNRHKASARAVGLGSQQQQQPHDPLSRSHSTVGEPQSQELARLCAVDVNIESFANTNGKYWYLVRVMLSNGTVRSLCRFYEDFFNYHQAVLNTWPREGGKYDTKERKERIIPFIPGPLMDVNESLCHKRLVDLDLYLKTTLQLPDYISKTVLINSFFELLDGDQQFANKDSVQNIAIHPQRSPPNMVILNRSETTSLQPSAADSPQQQGQSNTRNSQYQQDRLSQYEHTKGLNSSSIGKRLSGLHLQDHQQQQQQQQHRQSSLSTTSSASKQQPDSESTTKYKLKFYYKDDIFAIVVSETVSLSQLKQLVVQRIDEQNEPGILDKLRIVPKTGGNIDAEEYIESDELSTDEGLWSCRCFKDKGKFLVIV